MRVYHSIEEFSAVNPVVTVGMFDGVHAGHRSILRQLEVSKHQFAGESVLITFWPHPRLFFGRMQGFSILSTIEEKLQLLSDSGLDVCLVLPFTNEFAQLCPEEYIQTILCKGVGAKKVIIGYDHKYGKDGRGSYGLMQQYGKQCGFAVEQIKAFTIDSQAISSTKIRNLLADGHIEEANAYLSYSYFVNGVVVPGSQIGRTIGFPTANVHIDSELKALPAPGVYAGYAECCGVKYKSVINIGTNPTVKQCAPLSIEAHLIDFQGDLYKKNLKISFLKRLRDEQRFSSLDELKQAIEQDVNSIRDLDL